MSAYSICGCGERNISVLKGLMQCNTAHCRPDTGIPEKKYKQNVTLCSFQGKVCSKRNIYE